jgi:hypothetical protein
MLHGRTDVAKASMDLGLCPRDLASLFLLSIRVLHKRDDPKLLDDSGEVPRPNGVVGGSTLGREIASLLDGELAGGQVPHVFQD